MAISTFITTTAAEERGSLLDHDHVETLGYGTHHVVVVDEQEEPQPEDDTNSAGGNDDNDTGSAEDPQNTTDEEAPPPIEPFDEIEQGETERDSMIERLTSRLRCLFSAITWPIVPLGTLVSLCLVWVLYAAFVEDLKSSCSHPLHAFALASMCFLVYAPYHAQIRTRLFRYSRDRDGPIRPTRVRLYDQLFHTLCILYVYGGVTLMQSCKQDFGDSNNHGGENNNNNGSGGGGSGGADATFLNITNETAPMMLVPSSSATSINTCEATCPQLYASLDVYVTMLELFTLSLILPLLFLPCIYLWILRRASSEAEHLWEASLEDNNNDGGGDLFGRRRPRVTAAELMQSLETVKLIRRHEDNALVMKSMTNQRLNNNDASSSSSSSHNDVVKDCCICMSDFSIQEGDGSDDEEAQQQQPQSPSNNNNADTIVRTKCGHVFHTACLGNWIGGRWDPAATDEANRRRARRTCCPLCREDLQPATAAATTTRRLATTRTNGNETTGTAQ